jgi:hypothetical protein
VYVLSQNLGPKNLERRVDQRIQGRGQDAPTGSILVFSFNPKERCQAHKLGTQKHVQAKVWNQENVHRTISHLEIYQNLYLEVCYTPILNNQLPVASTLSWHIVTSVLPSGACWCMPIVQLF